MSGDEGLSSELQLEILSLVVKDKIALLKFRGVLTESHFSNPIHQLIFGIVRDYFEKYKKIPSTTTLKQEVQRILNDKKGYVPDSYFWNELDKVYSVRRVESREYILDRIADFLIKQELLKLSQLAIQEIRRTEKASLQVIAQQFKKITTMTGGGDFKADFLLKNIDSWIMYNEHETKIPTGFAKLDRALGGGLGKKELGIVLAPTGRGKSATLIQFGVNALRIGKKVLHITLELGKERVKNRYISSFSKIPKDDLRAKQTQAKMAIKRIRRVVGISDVVIEEFPMRSCSVDTLRGYIYTLQIQENFSPDLIVIDYADLLRPEIIYATEHRHQLGAIYETLRGLATELDRAIWTCTQTNRSGLSKPIVTILDIAESFEKAMIADVVLAICLYGKTRVRMADGRILTIDHIVKHRLKDKIMSWNPQSGILEGKRIINWYKSPLGDRKLYKIISKLVRQPAGYAGPVLTGDHKVYTKTGMVLAKDINGHLVNSGTNGFNKIREQVFIGTLMGDASLRGSFSFAHVKRDYDYLSLKVKLLNMDREYQYRAKQLSGHVSLMVKASKRLSLYLQYWRKKFYPSGKKRFPSDLVLTPIVLAFWYMDDGSLHKRKNQAELAVAGRSLGEVKLLIQKLSLLGLESKISLPPWKIRFNVENSRKLSAIIVPYVPKSMNRKLIPQYKQHCGENIAWLLKAVGGEVFYAPMWAEPFREVDGKKKVSRIATVYSLEVEDNNNFVAPQCVVSNCRTTRERRINEGRFFLAKNRDNISEVTVPFKEDLASNRFWEVEEASIPQEEFEELQRRWEERTDD